MSVGTLKYVNLRSPDISDAYVGNTDVPFMTKQNSVLALILLVLCVQYFQ